MDFQTIKTALIDTLSAGANGEFVTVGHERQTKSADRINENRLVQAFYEAGSFPSSSGNISPIDHDMTFRIRLTVVADAKGDLAVLDNAGSTTEERATAIQGILSAAETADSELDDLISLVWNILMDARNKYLGLEKGFIGSRWIPSIKKDQTVEDGQYAVKTADITYTCETGEEVQGDTGNKPDPVIMDSETYINEDTETKTGIEVKP